MAQKETVQYTVEREFLSKITVEELLIRIVRSHLENSYLQIDRYESNEKSP